MKTKLFALLLFGVSRVLADGLPSVPYIYVQGHAFREAEPDFGTVTFNISKTNPEIEASRTQIVQQGRAILEAINSLGIPRADVTAFEISMEPKFSENRQTGERNFAGYTISRSFTVRLGDLTKYGPLIDSLLSAKVERINRGIELGTTKEDAIRSALVADSLLDARRNAEATAAKLGMKVTSVFSVSRIPPTQIMGQMFPYFDPEGGRIGRGLSVSDYIFGKITLVEHAFVVFLIEPVH